MGDGVVRIEKILCVVQSEEGSDEVVLRRDGLQIWPDGDEGVGMSNGVEVAIGRDILFGNSTEVAMALFDQDAIGADDDLGTAVIHESEAGSGLRTADIVAPGSQYRLTYKVGRVQF
ncbi:hypothetical protein [Streptomyces vietnamensis]|uniref:hypothetical protein n=1 Tax=Streptomyces vietnamensis TaxID=362257 RepID=UPI001C54E8AB|nr:hypothetical protein [Streptomyces vietnamensis]